jgi:hypothetical protein
MDSRAWRVNPTGSFSRSAAQSSNATPIGSAERVVGRGLVGHDVDRGALGEHPRHQLRRVAEQADGERTAGVPRLDGQRQRVLRGVGAHIQVAVLDTTPDRARVDVDTDRDAVVHRYRQRLGHRPCRRDRRQRDGSGQRGPAELAATAANVSYVP